jgi:1-aminocyclopropane-1-carboxylate deaminase/D-cysteine desulfhydrase-like pyridoxal-dependent ACC family enzyme
VGGNPMQTELGAEQAAPAATWGNLGKLHRLLQQDTPVQELAGVLCKRDDLFEAYGAPGGKARTCLAILMREAVGGGTAVTASSRHSPQAIIVAMIAEGLGLGCRVHVPAAKGTAPELELAKAHGAEIVEHRPGYNSVIVKRALEDVANDHRAAHVPFGMECLDAVGQTSMAVANMTWPEGRSWADVKRIVVPVGSGMTAAGLLHGLRGRQLDHIPVVGVAVGADPVKRLDGFAPYGWRDQLTLVYADPPYHEAVEASIGGVPLDPIYEAKCMPYLEAGDLFWIVGIRANLVPTKEEQQ